jgi:uncharacterized protein (DUF2147 family)
MKRWGLIFFLLVFTFGVAQKHSILGHWKTIDDESGRAVSVVEIYEAKGKIYGRVAELLIPSDRSKTCSNCEGNDKDKPILGMVVIKGLKKEDGVYKGKILDPKHGRVYQCTLQLESKDKLKVRGYIGISLLGRTQIWHRVK